MSTENMMYLIAAIALLAYLGSGLLRRREEQGSKLVQYALIWGLIFLGGILAIGAWEDIKYSMIGRNGKQMSDGGISIPRGKSGHYEVSLLMNGEPVDFIVDTGATNIVITKEDARRIGFDPENMRYLGQASTANGIVRTHMVRVAKVEIGDIVDENVKVWVNDGELFQSLLGMAYLEKFGRITIESGMMKLER
jgi:aspartyl protease family protein